MDKKKKKIAFIIGGLVLGGVATYFIVKHIRKGKIETVPSNKIGENVANPNADNSFDGDKKKKKEKVTNQVETR